jgi:hypothetical protein
LPIASAILAAIAVGAAGFLFGRSTVEPTHAPPAVTPAQPISSPAPAPVLPTVQRPLSRAELIAAANSAADAFAAGRPLPESVTGLVGRDFELRLPFGCPGASQLGAGALSVQYDQAAETLRARAEPVRWVPQEWLPNQENMPEAAPVAESIEGFWIPRPWTSSEACPPTRPASTGVEVSPVPAEQTLGIAQFFTADESRVGRRDGKAYQAVESVAPGALEMGRGLHLRLRGKLARAPGGGPILCRAPSATRPTCLLVVAFDEVAIELAGASLATWDVSSQTREPVDR